MSSGWLTGFDVLAGLASLYGAIEAFRQKRKALKASVAARQTEMRVRRLIQRTNAQQEISSLLANLRLAEMRLSVNADTQVTAIRAHLGEVAQAIARLSARSETQNILRPAKWAGLQDSIRDLNVAVAAASFPIKLSALRSPQRMLLEAITEFERAAAMLSDRIGAEHASND